MASAAIIQEIIVWEKGEDEEEVVVRFDCHECIKVKHVESLPWWVLQW